MEVLEGLIGIDWPEKDANDPVEVGPLEGSFGKVNAMVAVWPELKNVEPLEGVTGIVDAVGVLPVGLPKAKDDPDDPDVVAVFGGTEGVPSWEILPPAGTPPLVKDVGVEFGKGMALGVAVKGWVPVVGAKETEWMGKEIAGSGGGTGIGCGIGPENEICRGGFSIFAFRSSSSRRRFSWSFFSAVREIDSYRLSASSSSSSDKTWEGPLLSSRATSKVESVVPLTFSLSLGVSATRCRGVLLMRFGFASDANVLNVRGGVRGVSVSVA